jgi:hypothetical protein
MDFWAELRNNAKKQEEETCFCNPNRVNGGTNLY